MAALTFPNFPKCPETGNAGNSRTSRAPYKGAGKTGRENGTAFDGDNHTTLETQK
jgi:hypothetical protein